MAEKSFPALKWEKLKLEKGAAEEVTRPSLTYWQDVWRRLKRNKLSLFGLGIILVVALLAVFGPLLSAHSYYEQDLSFNNLPPILDYYQISDNAYVYVHKEFTLIDVSPGGEVLGRHDPVKNDVANKQRVYEIDGKNVVVDYQNAAAQAKENAKTGADTAKFSLLVDGQPVQKAGAALNRTYPFGTDSLGRDLFVRVLYGARISLTVALVATLVQFFVGVIYGGVAGYFGGMVDNVMMRIVDTVSSVPLTLYVILLMVVLQPGLGTIILAIGLVYWVGMARLVRGEVLRIKNQEYVLAAQTIGASTARIMKVHLIPNAMGSIIVTMTMDIPRAIFTESFLSFIGLGISAPMASWGTLCNDALGGLRTYPYQLLFPALFICVTVLAFNFLGDGLRDALDPRLRK